jgi:CRISPR-associated protein Csd1
VILQALVEYYDRRCALDPEALPRQGWERKALPFIVEITLDGEFVQIVDTRPAEGKPRRGKEFLVPKAVVRTSGIAANLLWDNVEYALGVSGDGPAKRVADSHAAFQAEIVERFGTSPTDPHIGAVLAFLRHSPVPEMQLDPRWDELINANPFISFRVAGTSRLVCQGQVPEAKSEARETICLVSGRSGPVARLHPAIKGIRGGNTSGTALVSYNLAAFESYGREQGDNAPISEEVAFKYTTALNDLLGASSTRRVWLGNSTYVFWAEKASAEPLERGVAGLFSEPPRDDPDRGAQAIRDVLSAVSDGSWTAVPDGGGRFYVLGLSPNAGRAAVRTWTVATAVEIAVRLGEHFEDLKIEKPTFAPEHPSLFRLLRSVAVQGKADNVPPNLEGDVAYAILSGTEYPLSLLAAAVRRSCADGGVTLERAALIKAVLNRHRRAAGRKEEEHKVSLDVTNPAPAYRLGRLFAALEKAQEEASPGLNATIKDRYYGAASSTPITVFPRLLDLDNHHLAKIESQGRRIWLEKLIGEIVDGIPRIPSHLSLIEQGDFAIGYYQQRQDFFKKHATNDGENN